MSNSTLSATSHEDRQNVTEASHMENRVDGPSPQDDDDLDEMEVEYIEVNGEWVFSSFHGFNLCFC